MFNITVEDPAAREAGESKHIHIWQNSWGLTTRSIGVTALTHLVIPPRVAEIQVIIIPVGATAKTTSEEKEKLYNEIDALAEVLRPANVRVETDMREGYSPGWKFNDWELKGISLRIEFGPKDSARHVVTTSRRGIDNKDEARGETPISELKRCHSCPTRHHPG